METLGKSHQLRVTNFFAPTKSKEDREFYQTNMVSSEYSILDDDGAILMPRKGLSLNSLSVPCDFYFDLTLACQKELVQRIVNTQNTIFSVLAGHRAHLTPNANITAILKTLKLRKPEQTGVIFRGVYINDREFLASANTKSSLPGADTFYVALGEKAEEAKELRRQHIFYFYDWNELVMGCIKNLGEGRSQHISLIRD